MTPEAAHKASCKKSRPEGGECTEGQDLVYVTLNSRKTRRKSLQNAKKAGSFSDFASTRVWSRSRSGLVHRDGGSSPELRPRK